jgi:hypothetical protein
VLIGSFFRNIDNKLSAFLESGCSLSLAFLQPAGDLSMQIIIESRDADATPMRELSIARVRFALRRLRALVPRAKVQFSDVNGPRGGVDKRCQVELKTDSAGTVVIASLARDWRTALDRSLSRATRVLTRSLQRSQKPARGRSARLALGGSNE